MICQSFRHFSQKHAHGFVPLPYQPENNDIPVQTPPIVALDALRTLAVSRIYLEIWFSLAPDFSRVSGVERKS
jgi:2-iminoacetate synthase ThiH